MKDINEYNIKMIIMSLKKTKTNLKIKYKIKGKKSIF